MIFINKKFIFTILFIVLFLGNVGLMFLVFNNTAAAKQESQAQQKNTKILAFTNLFIEKVLMSDQPVDFDTRLNLETMVRNLNDKEILDQWNAFTGASDNQTASIEAKKLLDLLVKSLK